MSPHNEHPGPRMAAIDAELEALYVRIAALIEERNSITPISTLPNEVLARILGVYAEDSISVSGVQWTKVMLVCRHWHKLALGTPTLWCNIRFLWESSKPHLLLQLERSRAAPLKIEIRSLTSNEFTDSILSNSGRLESLVLGGDPTCLLTFMDEMRNHAFPILESLSLALREDVTAENADRQFTLPPELFDGRMPRLRSLSLARIDAHWQCLASLRSLSLTSGPDSPSTQISLPTLFNVLKSSPELTTLRLDMVIASGSSDRNSEAVRLLLLDFLYIRDSLAYCEDVLAHLIFPATTRVEMYPQGITSGVDIRDILVLLRKHLCARSAPIPTMLAIRVPRSDQENISHFSTAAYLEPTFPAGLSRDKLFGINSHPDNARALRQIMTKVLKTLPTQAITHLDAGSAHLTVRSWKTALALLPALEAVYMHIDDAGTRFCEAVLDMEHHVPLRTIQLALFAHHDPDEDPVDTFLEVLKRLLRAYRARGTSLIHLLLKDWFSNFDMNETKWLELGDLVVHFELELRP
ncbi:hypothetical protein C8R44DRAFT_852233 [Mycena epipterygia]|nr:hypothetical protein C8R44DRAFT_852233 [Mycena epipterygia]